MYTLDYGLYVDLLDRRHALMPEFAKAKRTTATESSEDVIALDTRRYLRGCVLQPGDFEAAGGTRDRSRVGRVARSGR